MYATYRISNNSNYKTYYKNYCKILSSVITTAKKMYFDKLLLKSTNRPSTIWNIVKTLTNNVTTSSNIEEMNINNNLTSNSSTIANAFNAYFSSVAENLTSKNYPGTDFMNTNDPLTHLKKNFKQTFSSIRLNNTTTHEVDKIIHSLKCMDSYGYDEVSTRILKNSAPYILSPLTHIFNKILSTGIFPDRLKFSEVKPLFKKGDRIDFSNYRPISLLTSFSKIIEKIIHKRVYQHFNEKSKLVEEQFGFREKSSTDMATYALLNSVLSSLDKKHFIGGIFATYKRLLIVLTTIYC